MYDVNKMRAELEDAVSKAEQNVRNNFLSSFKDIYEGNKVPNKFEKGNHAITKYILRTEDDLHSIMSGAGFYIILSSYDMPNNNCRLTYSNQKTIYRGESVTLKKRIQSHLFNRQYKEDYKNRENAYLKKPKNKDRVFYEQKWPACLKLNPRVSGINVDIEPYNSCTWFVIVHEMKGSSQEVRKQAELAFDEAFGKPGACRE